MKSSSGRGELSSCITNITAVLGESSRICSRSACHSPTKISSTENISSVQAVASVDSTARIVAPVK
ncbi:hypothetical protein D3C78_1910260 [compost metagenome]